MLKKILKFKLIKEFLEIFANQIVTLVLVETTDVIENATNVLTILVADLFAKEVLKMNLNLKWKENFSLVDF